VDVGVRVVMALGRCGPTGIIGAGVVSSRNYNCG
jgi:hypothetical protein